MQFRIGLEHSEGLSEAEAIRVVSALQNLYKQTNTTPLKGDTISVFSGVDIHNYFLKNKTYCLAKGTPIIFYEVERAKEGENDS